MNLDEILSAVKAKTITLAEAEKLIASLKRNGLTRTSTNMTLNNSQNTTTATKSDASVSGLAPAHGQSDTLSDDVSEPGKSDQITDSSRLKYVQPELRLESVARQLSQTLAQALFMDESEVKDEASFIDMGLDSIVGVEWMREINRLFNLDLPVTELYDFPTIPQLSQRIISQAAGAVALDSPLQEKTVPENTVQKTTVQKTTLQQTPTASSDLVKNSNANGMVVSTVQNLQDITLSPWQVNSPQAGEVTVLVKASAVNFPDAMCVNGLYPTMPAYPFVPGFEVAGIVTEIGAGVSEFAIGDEIVAITGEAMGGHASLVNVPADNAIRKPNNVTFEEACSLPVAFGIVYYAYTLAQLQPQEKVLVQTATGGCGLLGIQLARLAGCEVFGTSSREAKLEVLRRLNVAHRINYKTDAFDQRIADITQNKGVDAVLNMLSSEYIQAGLNSLAPSGRYLEIAVHALKTSPKLDLSGLVSNQSIHSIDLRRLSFATGEGAKSQLQAMVALLEEELITPILSRVYPFNDIAQAIQYVGQGQHIGKVVISHTCDQMIDYTDMCIARMLEQQHTAALRVKNGNAGIHPAKSSKTALQSQTALANPVHKEAQVASDQACGVEGKVDPNPLSFEYSALMSKGSMPQEPIAVIGMAGQFPQSPDLQRFWHNLKNGIDCVAEVSPQRWDANQFYDPDPQAPGKTNCKWMGQIPDADKFDPAFFNISPNEAVAMDPQQRKILETSWHCIEEAGINADDLSGALCGIFIGVAPGDYGMNADDESDSQGLSSHGLMGRSMSILSARTAFFLNLKGPCITLDTACSSSLVAIAEACNNLLLGNCDVALAGGVNVMSTPNLHIMTSKAEMLSPDGRCFTFDNRANGFVPCEGVGMLLLKTLSAAKRNGDTIKGLVRGWGVNQDGKTNGITAPSTISQTELAQRVYDRFDISPDTIELIEAHGTGTKLGDPIEIRALKQAFANHTTDAGYCALGSVKSSIGHGLASAGVAGAIKVLLALQHKVIPPLANFNQLNEHIELSDSPFYIPTEAQNWQSYHVGNGADGKKATGKRAAVSSFGFSGTNAHLVFEEAPAKPELPLRAQAESTLQKGSDTPLPMVISARNMAQLTARVQQLNDYLNQPSLATQTQLADLAYTLLTGRRLFKQRLVLIASSVAELQLLLGQVLAILNQSHDDLPGALNPLIGVHYGKVGNSVKPDLDKLDSAEQTLAQLHAATSLNQLNKDTVSELAGLLVQGYKLPFAQLFGVRPQQRFQRLSLPLYPFAKQRYWLQASDKPASVSPASSSQSEPSLSQRVAVQNTQLSKAGRVALVAPDLVSALPNKKQQIIAKPTLQLAAIAVESTTSGSRPDIIHGQTNELIQEQTQEQTVFIDVVDHGGEVFSVSVNQPVAEQHFCALAQQLKAAFTQLASGQNQTTKVILLQQLHYLCKEQSQAHSQERLTSENYGQQLQHIAHTILQCPVPVITLLDNAAEQHVPALVAASACDLLVLQNHEPGYGWSLTPSVHGALLDFIQERFDTHARAHVSDGLQLQLAAGNQTNGLHFSDDTVKQAWRLAYQLAEKPLIALKQLKAHLAAPLLQALASATSKTALLSSPLASSGQAFEQSQWFREFAMAPVEAETNAKVEVNPGNSIACHTFGNIVHVNCYGNGVAEIVLQDESQHNMLSNGMMAAISDAFEYIAALSEAKVVIITGYAQYFSLGGTKAGLQSIHSGEVKFTDSQIYSIAMQCDLPVIAAIQGHGIGAGWALGMYADMVILGQESIYISPYMSYGFTPGAGATLVFTRKYGKDLGREILFTAREYTGRELAQRSNAIAVLPRQQVLNAARAMAAQLANHSVEALRAFKANTRATLANHIEQVYQLEQAMHEVTFVGNADVLAGIENRFVDNAQQQYQTAQSTSQLTSSHHSTSNEPSSTDPEGNDTMNQSDVSIESIDKQSLRDVLIATLAEQLGMDNDEIEPDQEFVELGLDSVVGVTWIRKINETYGLNVAVTKVYQYPTIDQLCEHIFGLLPSASANDDVAKNSLSQHQISKNQSGQEAAPQSQSQQSPASQTPAHQIEPTQAVKVQLNLTAAGSVPLATPVSPAQPISSLANSDQARNEQTSPAQLAKDIAIIGMAGRFPHAEDLNQFWQNIAQQKDCVEEVPASRWDISKLYDPDPRAANKTYSKWMGRVEGADYFDPLFFSISPQEALAMDPQQRLILQESWHCLENAGYDPDSLSGSLTGVYIGCGPNDYGYVHANDMDAEGLTGSSASILTGRISYQLNLQGPCVAIDTACSSSLVAIAQACDGLILNNCDLALAGGVCVMAGSTIHVMTSNAGMLSPDGRCFTFDQRANGFVPGEGVGVALLKRLADAQRDGDRIDAVITGWGTNQDGKTNGITAPNPESQTRLQRSVYDRFNINPADIQLIETHGTGTKLGDPIEIEALAETYSHYLTANAVIPASAAIGSVKSNIGHAQAAAGIASVMKVALALKHKQLPPTANFDQLNEHISLAGTPFYINTELSDWEQPKTTSKNANSARHASVSSFGFSGTNAHIVLKEYVNGQENQHQASASQPVLVLLSARTPEQLLKQVQQLRDFVASYDQKPSEQELNLSDIAYTLQVGRKAMDCRLAILCHSVDDLLKKTGKLLKKAGNSVADITKAKAPKECYLGQAGKDKPALAMFSDNEELKATITDSLGKWLQQQKLTPLAELWVKGINPDWAKLYQAQAPLGTQAAANRRLALPTYPFAEQSYWIRAQDSEAQIQSKTQTQNETKASTQESGQKSGKKPKTVAAQKPLKLTLKEDEQLRITEVWRNAPLADIKRLQALVPQLSDKGANANDISPIRVLVLFQKVREGEKLVEELAAQIDAYAPVLKDKVQIRREQIATMDETFYLDLQAQPADVIFFLGAAKPALNGSDSNQEKVLKPIFELSRNMVAHNSSHNCDLYYCSIDPLLTADPSVDKDNDESFQQRHQFTLFQQGLSGLFRAIGAEAPAKTFRTIAHPPEAYSNASAYRDIVGEWLSSWFRAKATALQPNAAINKTAPAQNAMIRYCEVEGETSSIRQIARLEELPVPNSDDKSLAVEAVNMRVGGTYLIAGGLGEVGLAVCQKLAEQYQPTLVFLSRRDMTADINSQLQTLRDAGATVHYFSVDITDYAALESVYGEVKAALSQGNINGVWHFARQVNDARIEHKTTREFFDTVSAKTVGTINLDTITQNEPLDVFLMFSSMAAFGIEGSCDYGYSTGFQNHFARYRNRLAQMNLRSGLGCAICWGQWTLDKYSNEQRDLLLWQMGFDFITPDQAIPLTEILLQAATQTDGVAGVMAINDKNRVRKFYQLPTLFAAPAANSAHVNGGVNGGANGGANGTGTATSQPLTASVAKPATKPAELASDKSPEKANPEKTGSAAQSTTQSTSQSTIQSDLSLEQVLQSVDSSTPEHEISRLKARLLTQSTDELVAIYQKLVNEE